MELTIRRVERAFREPHLTARGKLRSRSLVLIELRGADGIVGRGEAAPLPSYDGVSVELVLEALEAYRPVLADAPAAGPRGLLDALRDAADLPQALAAVDVALWDLAGRRAGRPVCELLSEHPARSVAVNATIGAGSVDWVAAEAARAAADGFTCVKLKVGLPGDAARVAAVRRAIGPNVALRLDANGAWTLEEAQLKLEHLAVHGLELVEEPVRGLQDMQALRERVAVRVALDESAALHGALTARVADAVCLKLSRCGGIGGLLAAAALVRASGAEAYVASTYDGPIGIAAAVHAAAALSPLPACGLATLELFSSDEPSPLPVLRGRIAVPRGPGLGI